MKTIKIYLIQNTVLTIKCSHLLVFLFEYTYSEIYGTDFKKIYQIFTTNMLNKKVVDLKSKSINFFFWYLQKSLI